MNDSKKLSLMLHALNDIHDIIEAIDRELYSKGICLTYRLEDQYFSLTTILNELNREHEDELH